jgi:hypothetical protein
VAAEVLLTSYSSLSSLMASTMGGMAAGVPWSTGALSRKMFNKSPVCCRN